jgi:hypothetical protein
MTRARDLAAFVSNADGDIKFDTDTLFIDSSANSVGIGTTSPQTQLQLQSTTPFIRLQDDQSSVGAGVNMGGIEFRTADSTVVGASRITAKIKVESDATFNASDKSPSNMIFSTHGTSGTDPVDRVTIDSSGNVGIGTTSPAFPLDVSTNSSTTNDAVTTLRLSANTTGTAANNFGAAINFSGEDASGSLRDLSTINGIYTDATNRSSAITFKTRANLGSLTEEVRIDPDGLKFNGDTAAGNALSDYEEGTWTASASVGSITPNNTCSYIKVGNLVTIYFDIRSFTNTSNSAAIQIDGLPFASTRRAVGAVMHRYIDTLDDSIVAYADSGQSNVKFLANSSAGWAGVVYSDINSGSAILAGTITYKVV